MPPDQKASQSRTDDTMSVMGHDEGMAAASEAFRQARQEVEYFGASEDFTRNPLEAAVEAYLDATNLRGAVEQNEHLLHGICDALKHLPPGTESAGTAILRSLLRGTSHDHAGGQ